MKWKLKGSGREVGARRGESRRGGEEGSGRVCDDGVGTREQIGKKKGEEGEELMVVLHMASFHRHLSNLEQVRAFSLRTITGVAYV